MNEKLDVRSAIRDATTAFRRFPILLSLPVVSIGLASWGLNPIIHPASSKNLSLFVLIMVFAVVCLVLTSIAEVLTAAMYLRTREGVEPSLKQAGEVVRYRGLFSLIIKLFLLYLGWGLLLGLICCGIMFVMIIVSSIGHIARQSSSGIGATVGGLGGIGIAIGMAVSLVIWSRYMFVLPALAITRSRARAF